MSKLKTGMIALLAVMTTISIMGITSTYAQTIDDQTMCYGYSATTLAPRGDTSAFLTTNEEAGVWVKIVDPPEDVTFKFYYDDDGVETEYAGGYSKVDVIPKADTNWGIAFATMDISGKTPASNPGVWECWVYIDGEVAKIIEFNIIDYDELVSQISTITTTVEGIIEEKNQVVDDYAELVADYEALTEAYEDQEDQIQELEDTTVSELELFGLQQDYDDLVAAQGSTKTMMYAAIVVALIAVVVAVYFGLMKK
jgi:hypothetical protein